MERIAAEFNATVLAITHPGKDASRGSIGSSLIESLAFAIWRVSLLDDNTIRLWVDKMKDGPAEFAVLYRVERGANGVPVVADLPPGEQVKYGAADDPKAQAQLSFKLDVLRTVRARWEAGHTDTVNLPTLAPLMAKQSHSDPEAVQNATASIGRRLRRHAAKGDTPGILAELMLCDGRGLPLTEPYTFKTWPEVEAVARCLGLEGQVGDDDPTY
jgi:hypothetical protein